MWSTDIRPSCLRGILHHQQAKLFCIVKFNAFAARQAARTLSWLLIHLVAVGDMQDPEVDAQGMLLFNYLVHEGYWDSAGRVAKDILLGRVQVSEQVACLASPPQISSCKYIPNYLTCLYWGLHCSSNMCVQTYIALHHKQLSRSCIVHSRTWLYAKHRLCGTNCLPTLSPTFCGHPILSGHCCTCHVTL